MPGGDQTGPLGMGSMTGRAAGYCAGFGMPGYNRGAFGRGRGAGFGGGGRGRRCMYRATGAPGWIRWGTGTAVPCAYPMPAAAPDPQTAKTALKNQAEALQAQLQLVNRRLAEMNAAAAEG